MSEFSQASGRPDRGSATSKWALPLFMLALGVITMIGSLQVGIGWGDGRAEVRLLPVLDRL